MTMFAKTFHATHPDMMEDVSNDDLRARYLVSGMFEDGRINLNYSHNERFVIGRAAPKGGMLTLPEQSEPASAAGHLFLEPREMAAVNIGTDGAITVDGPRRAVQNQECLYIQKGALAVTFEARGTRLYRAPPTARHGTAAE